MNEILTTDHKLFLPFMERLIGNEGIEIKIDNDGEFTDRCNDDSLKYSEVILNTMSGIDVDATLEYFMANGGYCDCEVIVNVAGLEFSEALAVVDHIKSSPKSPLSIPHP